MDYPKIVFREITLEENLNIVKDLYFDCACDSSSDLLDVYKCIIEYFPELSKIDDSWSFEEINSFIEKVITDCYEQNKEVIKRDVFRYNDIWNNYNNRYFEVLMKYLNIAWPEDKMVIDAVVGLLPVAPRDLDSFYFLMSINVKDWQVVDIAAHEALHFIWFEKWKELYPECPRALYDSPYIPWQYSEMVVDSILNSKPIKDVLRIDVKAYDSFYKIKDGNSYLMDNLKNVYDEDLPIEERIVKGFDYVKNVLGEN